MRGGYPLCTVLDPSPPVSSPHLPLHGCTIKVLSILRGRYDRFKVPFSIQRLTAQRPHPGSFRPCNGPGVLPLCTCVLQLLHTVYSCLYLSPQPTHSGYWLCATLDPSPPCSPVSLPPLLLHGHTINVLNILRGTYIHTIDSRPRSASKGLQLEDLTQARLDA